MVIFHSYVKLPEGNTTGCSKPTWLASSHVTAKSLAATWWDSLDALVTGSHVSAPESWIRWHPRLVTWESYQMVPGYKRWSRSNSHCIEPMSCPQLQSAVLAKTTSHLSPQTVQRWPHFPDKKKTLKYHPITTWQYATSGFLHHQ
jgi:hypothetical protein